MLRLNCTRSLNNLEGNALITSENSVSTLYRPYPSNDLICKCFLRSFAENKCYFFNAMASLTTRSFITIDHTFHVASNVGYLCSDGRWITQYSSLFIVLNDVSQVFAWQLTKTTSMDECKELLCALRNRQLSHGTAIEEVYTDNCCTIKAKIHSIFGPNVHTFFMMHRG